MSDAAWRSKYAVIEAPTTLGLRRERADERPGVHALAHALQRAGFYDQFPALHAGIVVETTGYSEEPDPECGILNAGGVADYMNRLADRVSTIIDLGRTPLVLGGDCSIVLGSGLALRRRGRYGLISLDGHTDYYPPEHSRSRQVAAMEIWLATGHGPALLANPEGFDALFEPHDVVMLGYRDDEEHITSCAPDPALDGVFCAPWRPYYDMRRQAERAVEYLRGRPIAGIWLHVDVDVIDSRRMPAVDSPQPGGLEFAEFVDIIRLVRHSGLLAGCDITIFDPTRDPDGVYARALSTALAKGLC
jgi:arginase